MVPVRPDGDRPRGGRRRACRSRRPARSRTTSCRRARCRRSSATCSRTSSSADRRSCAATCATREYAEEAQLLALGLRSRVAAPLLAGARTIGLISLVRRDVDAFDEEEIELVGLLGRLIASAVQNIRAYDSERRTVEELPSAVGAASRLRLARLTRAAQPDGGGDRRGAHAAAALARAAAGAAGGVPGADRRRDRRGSRR